MDLNTLKDFIKPELLILIPVLYFIGVAFKNAKSVPDHFIPLFLGFIGIILSAVWVVATSSLATYQDVSMSLFTGITQGILCSGCSVYINQLIKQTNSEE